MLLKKTLAWCVHAYTALGLVAAAGMMVALFDGQPASFHFAFFLMFVATLVDATDGTLARAVDVKKVLPGFDGRRLDDLIDFQTFTVLPLMLIWRAELIPREWAPWLLAPLLASAYGFCQTSAKTDDGYFLGFPSYWNIVALYLYLLQLPHAVALGLILFFAALTFVPARYLYPTAVGRFNRLTIILGVPWILLLLWLVWRLPEQLWRPPVEGWGDLYVGDDLTRILGFASLIFPAYYLVLSWAISIQFAVNSLRKKSAP